MSVFLKHLYIINIRLKRSVLIDGGAAMEEKLYFVFENVKDEKTLADKFIYKGVAAFTDEEIAEEKKKNENLYFKLY